MSKIPFAQVQGDGVVSVGTPPLQSIEGGSAFGKGLETLGQSIGVVADVQDKMQQARESQDVGNKLVESNGKLDAYRLELDKEPDFATREAKFQVRRQQVLSDQVATLGSYRAGQDFTLRYNQLAGTMQLQVRHEARDQENQNFRIDLSDSLGKLATQAVFARSAEERGALQAEADKQIVSAVQTGRMTSVQANQFKKAYLGKVDDALAGEMVRRDPGGAIGALSDPTQFPYLDAGRRQERLTQATNRSESLGVQARAEARQDGALMLQAIHAGQPVRQEDVDRFVRRVGPKSPIGMMVQRAYDFSIQVQTAAAGKSTPELLQEVQRLNAGAANVKTHDGYPAPVNSAGQVMTELGMTITDPRINQGKPTNIPSLWEAKPRDQDEAIDLAVKSGRTFPSFDTIDQAVSASIERSAEKGRNLPGATPQELALARTLAVAARHNLQQIAKDPAQFVLGQYPTINETFAAADAASKSQDPAVQARAPDLRRQAIGALIDAQRREGVPEHRITLLTDPQNEAVQNAFTKAQGQQVIDLTATLRAQYGTEWTRVQNQIWKDKAPPVVVRLAGDLPPGANFQAVQLAEAMKLPEAEAKKLVGEQPFKAAIDEVTKASAEMQKTLNPKPGGQQASADYVTGAQHLALYKMTQGETDPVKAARSAMQELFYNHWEIVGATRIPKDHGVPIVQPGDVEALQRLVVDNLKSWPIALPEGASKDAFLSTVKTSGFWITTDDHRAMVLLAGPGRVVRYTNGDPVMMPWSAVRADVPKAPSAGVPPWLMDFFRQMQKSGATPVQPDQPGAGNVKPGGVQRFGDFPGGEGGGGEAGAASLDPSGAFMTGPESRNVEHAGRRSSRLIAMPGYNPPPGMELPELEHMLQRLQDQQQADEKTFDVPPLPRSFKPGEFEIDWSQNPPRPVPTGKGGAR